MEFLVRLTSTLTPAKWKLLFHFRRVKNSQYIKDIVSKLRNVTDEERKAAFPLLTKGEGNTLAIRNITQIATHNKISDFKENKRADGRRKAEQKTDFDKPYRYFALVQADGDNMGKVLEKVANQNLELFSERCMKFSQEAAKTIHQFGGVTVYAGGDDLLFMAPLYSNKAEGEQGRTVMELCKDLDALFREYFDDNFINKITGEKGVTAERKLALSFGITLNYHKSPLYEALKQTLFLLFVEAKGRKNAKVIELTKNSGSKISVPLYNNSEVESELIKLIHLQDEEEVVNSILYHLHEFEVLYDIAFNEGEERIKNFFYNMFDRHVEEDAENKTNDEITFKNPYVEQIKNLAIAHWRETENRNRSKRDPQNEQEGEEQILSTKELTSLLRLAKFFGEGAKDE